MKLPIMLFFSFCSLLSASVIASEQTDKTWIQELKTQKIDAQDQSYCYSDEKGDIQGSNVDMKIRLASVSKLLTSLWTIDKLGVDHKYNTKLYIKGNSLHIEGSFDPFMGNEKMFYLISQLNELGYTSFDTITFDKNMIMNPDSRSDSEVFPKIDAATMGGFLKTYFNTRLWTKSDRAEYSEYATNRPSKFKKTVSFEATTIKMVETNPISEDQTVKTYTLSSPPLYRYLKQMNVNSNNYVAETLFRQDGGVDNFAQFLSDRFQLTAEQIHFYSGSGLPTYINKVRKDNYATCRVMLNLISELKSTIERQGKTIEDVIAVPGSDGGTFRNRVFPSDFKNSFVAKTGTLMHTSALAGAMNTVGGFNFFGIFNQSTDISGSKTVQNAMVKSIMNDLGGPKAFDYKVEVFHPFNNINVKELEEDNSDFTSIEGGLF